MEMEESGVLPLFLKLRLMSESGLVGRLLFLEVDLPLWSGDGGGGILSLAEGDILRCLGVLEDEWRVGAAERGVGEVREGGPGWEVGEVRVGGVGGEKGELWEEVLESGPASAGLLGLSALGVDVWLVGM